MRKVAPGSRRCWMRYAHRKIVLESGRHLWRWAGAGEGVRVRVRVVGDGKVYRTSGWRFIEQESGSNSYSIGEPDSRCLIIIGEILSRRSLISDSAIHIHPPLSTSGTRPPLFTLTLATTHHLHPCPRPNTTRRTSRLIHSGLFCSATCSPKRQFQHLLACLVFWVRPTGPRTLRTDTSFGYPLAPNPNPLPS
jgi:hypothetical protein